MKNFIFATSVVLLASQAHAASTKTANPSDELFFKPYVGADYQFSKYGNKNIGVGVESSDIIDTGLNSGNVHVGARIHKNLGIEFGYAQSQTASKETSAVVVTNLGTFPIGKTETQTRAFTGDVLGYYPVTPQTELIGTVGVSYTKAEVSALGVNFNEKEWKPRVGAGAQYWLTDTLNTRALVRWQGADFDNSVGNAVVGTLGVNYQF